MTPLTRAELLDALTVERFQPAIPSDRTRVEVVPTLHEMQQRIAALYEEPTREKRTA